MKVTVSVEAEVPPNRIIYDVGAEQLRCNACGRNEACDMYPGRQGEPDFEGRIRDFVHRHTKCVFGTFPELKAPNSV